MKPKIYKILTLVTLIFFVVGECQMQSKKFQLVNIAFFFLQSYVRCQDDQTSEQPAASTPEGPGVTKEPNTDHPTTKKPTHGGGGSKGGAWKTALTQCLREYHIENIGQYLFLNLSVA